MQAYLQLINNTISYIQELLPKPENKPPPLVTVAKAKSVSKPAKPVKPPPKQIGSKNEKALELHPPLHSSIPASDKIGSLLKAVAPDLYLHQKPPSDEKAKRIKNAWNEKSHISEISILLQGPRYRPFLSNLAQAITHCFAPASVIEMTPFEKEKKWDIFLKVPKLKFILCPDHLIFSSKELLTFYKENLGKKTRFLGEIPLLLLPDLSLYYKDPYLKRSLWNVICQMLD